MDEPDDAPGAERAVDGVVLAALLDGAETAGSGAGVRVADALSTHGIDAPDDDQWYALVAYRDAVGALAENGDAAPMRAVGTAVADAVALPEGASVPAALSALDDWYCAHHCGDDGGFVFRQIGATDGRVECWTVSPCPLDQGLVVGVVGRVTGEFVRCTEVGACSDATTDRCTYDLGW
jgi:hypothetical protein